MTDSEKELMPISFRVEKKTYDIIKSNADQEKRTIANYMRNVIEKVINPKEEKTINIKKKSD